MLNLGHAPSRVTADEYTLYSAWTSLHFSKNVPDHLYFLNRTFEFNPETFGCGNRMHKNAGVGWSLIRQLSELGDAEYPLDFDSRNNLQISWGYKSVDAVPDLDPGTFHLLSFSRVAFNGGHTQALFVFSDECAAGLCGGGGVVYAHKKDGKWTFQNPNCSWKY
jgi:hypothetical protein